MLKSTPAHVRVHYHWGDGQPTSMAGYLHANQDPGMIGLVINEAAWQDAGVCQWRCALSQVTEVEILRAPYEPTIIDQMLDAASLTPRQRLVYDSIVEAGGRLQWRDIADVLDEAGHALPDRTVHEAIRALKAAGRITLTHSTDISSGIVTVNA